MGSQMVMLQSRAESDSAVASHELIEQLEGSIEWAQEARGKSDALERACCDVMVDGGWQLQLGWPELAIPIPIGLRQLNFSISMPSRTQN